MEERQSRRQRRVQRNKGRISWLFRLYFKKEDCNCDRGGVLFVVLRTNKLETERQKRSIVMVKKGCRKHVSHGNKSDTLHALRGSALSPPFLGRQTYSQTDIDLIGVARIAYRPRRFSSSRFEFDHDDAAITAKISSAVTPSFILLSSHQLYVIPLLLIPCFPSPEQSL